MTASLARLESVQVRGGAIPRPRADAPLVAEPTLATARRTAAEVEVVIPAYNEAVRLPATLERTVDFLASQPWSARVVVVDNGSVDDTAEVARSIAGSLDAPVPIDVIGCGRAGKGAAVRRGLLSSSSRIVGFFDADMATPVETLIEAVEELRCGATAVIASRHAQGARLVCPQPWTRRAGGSVFRAMTRSLVRGVADTQCGFKFFERHAVVRALVQCQLTGFAFDVELLMRLQADGGRIVELPVPWTDDVRSTFRPVRDGAASFAAVLRLQHGPR